jgi:hypothetical protein
VDDGLIMLLDKDKTSKEADRTSKEVEKTFVEVRKVAEKMKEKVREKEWKEGVESLLHMLPAESKSFLQEKGEH